MKKVFLLLPLLIAFLAESKACSCVGIHFCSYIQDTSVHVAVQAEVIGSVTYGPDNSAVYLKVLKKYKENTALTDTIKVYGNHWSATCYVHVLLQFPVGATVIAAFGWHQGNRNVLFNPDSLTENYYEIRPSSCSTILLSVENGVVSGRIAEGVPSYPLSNFEIALDQCQFPLPEEIVCNYSIYPVPSFNGKMYIEPNYNNDHVEKIRVFSIDGRLIGDFSGQYSSPGNPIFIDLPGSGIYVLEIFCNGDVHYKKITAM